MVYRWRNRLWLAWHRTDKTLLACALCAGAIVGGLGAALAAAYADQDRSRALLRQIHEDNLACLARNVYFEARGEPLAGQYAVAEVTLNRRGTAGFPRTVCEVVYQKTWDPQRQRYVGAFSWTEFDALPSPAGDSWLTARQVAENAYYRRQQPVLPGALYFHAVHIQPEWVPQHQRIARIGGHVFYR